jgi:hypothetical protein
MIVMTFTLACLLAFLLALIIGEDRVMGAMDPGDNLKELTVVSGRSDIFGGCISSKTLPQTAPPAGLSVTPTSSIMANPAKRSRIEKEVLVTRKQTHLAAGTFSMQASSAAKPLSKPTTIMKTGHHLSKEAEVSPTTNHCPYSFDC